MPPITRKKILTKKVISLPKLPKVHSRNSTKNIPITPLTGNTNITTTFDTNGIETPMGPNNMVEDGNVTNGFNREYLDNILEDELTNDNSFDRNIPLEQNSFNRNISIDHITIDQLFEIIKKGTETAKLLKKAIYPTVEEFRRTFEEEVTIQKPPQRNQYNDTQWNWMCNYKIIKVIQFFIFVVYESTSEINGAATYTQVQAWKKSEETTWCYNHLEELIDETDENSFTYMDTIVLRVFPDGSPSYNSTAYVMAVCSLMLDPNHSGITMSDEVTGILMTQYMDLLKENG
nr:12862_t:CDS:2 [Entrophospora candida]